MFCSIFKNTKYIGFAKLLILIYKFELLKLVP